MTDFVYSMNGEDFRDCEPEDFIEEFDERPKKELWHLFEKIRGLADKALKQKEAG